MTLNHEEKCTIRVRVQPKASRSELDGYEEGMLRLRVTAAPTDGKANSGVIALMAKTLGVGKSKLQIIRGQSSRVKIVSVDTLTEGEVRRRIEARVKH